MSAPIGIANGKPAIVLNTSYQRTSYQSFRGGTTYEPYGWLYCRETKNFNTLCVFNKSGGFLPNGEVFLSKEPTIIFYEFERESPKVSGEVAVNQFNAELGVYVGSTNGLNSGLLDVINYCDIGAYDSINFATAKTLADYLVDYVSGNPYSPGGYSGPGGGDGDFELDSDAIDFPDLPTLSATDAGFVSLWIPTGLELRNLARYMWNTDILTIDFWKKLVGDPIDLILSLAIYPTTIDTESDTKSVTVGFINTGVEMHYRNSQYIDVDCGTLSIPEYWAAYMDYSPYSKVSIFLPYIGTKPLNVDDVMNQDLHIRYRIDLVSGSCVAMIKVGDRVLYQFTGTCATAIPVNSQQMGNIIRSAVSLGVAVGATAGAIASGGALAAPAASAISSAANLATSKPDVSHSSSIGSASGLMAIQTPYLIIERPRQAIPEDQQTYTGFPSFITEDLGELNGYTEVEIIHLHGMSCTDEELEELDRLLQEGVIF